MIHSEIKLLELDGEDKESDTIYYMLITKSQKKKEDVIS